MFFIDSGPLPLLMMSKGYITSQVDKLVQYEKYKKVLQMEPTKGAEAEPKPAKKRTRQDTKKGHHCLPLLEDLRYLEEATAEKIEGKAPPQFEELRGKGQVSADIFNLSDMRQVMRVQRYLQDNGSYELFPGHDLELSDVIIFVLDYRENIEGYWNQVHWISSISRNSR